MKNLFITTAIMGSGKTTWARLQKGAYIVDPDDVRAMIHRGEYYFNPQLEDLIFNISYQLTDGLLKIGDVIFDDIGLSKKRRAVLINKYKGIARLISVHFPPRHEYLERRLIQPRGILAEQWIKVYTEMMNAYEKPSLDEGFDKIIEIR